MEVRWWSEPQGEPRKSEQRGRKQITSKTKGKEKASRREALTTGHILNSFPSLY